MESKAPEAAPEGPRFCDIVLKGGVTSGVVYPRAITRLAERYVFRSIGGTSVGAIAAALAAAAEYDRCERASTNGFDRLAKVPDFLGHVRHGKSNLLHQFRADRPAGRRQVDAALKLVGSAPVWKRLVRFEVQLALWYWWVVALPLVALVVLADPWNADPARPWRIGAAVVLAVLAALPALPALFVLRVWHEFATNAFGWCRGHLASNDESSEPVEGPLTDWLADEIDATAGLPLRATPLTFGMLAAATWNPAWGPRDDGEAAITLRMVTTCLTLQQPFELPFGTQSPGLLAAQPTFYWKESDFVRYFPKYVVQYMKRVMPAHHALAGFWRYPDQYALPVVVAARMSLSFPLLLSAVPLYAPPLAGSDIAADDLKRVWFSDGGLTSNMPIHLFDAPLPRWPTFALDLLGTGPQPGAATVAPDAPLEPFLESTLRADAVEPWERLDVDADGTRGDLLAFASAILDTTRTWRDRILGRLPGYADRTVGIRLNSNEGGVNLNMDAKTIQRMVHRGERAANLLIEKFAPDAPADSDWWVGHRWTRYRATMAAVSDWLPRLQKGFAALASRPSQRAYSPMIHSAVVPHTPGTPSASPPESAATAFAEQGDADAALAVTKVIAGTAADPALGILKRGAPSPHATLAPHAPF
ncbi:MAG: patatin-like phospholipase family protein [Candidatus Eremiobacteraeota bacterium]|nr:patatin-like phospholipase family protein [Candidatus Eremiobacteraeota bacterium]